MRELSLCNNYLTDDGVEALLDSAAFPNLRRLDLSENDEITDTSAHMLARSEAISNLEELDLSATGISREGVDALLGSATIGEALKRQIADNFTS